jgi:hypothetical protein
MALGTQLWYSNNDTPETWTLETAKIKITIKDAAIGKPRTMDAMVVNTVDPLTGQHSKELIYTSFRRVKVVEYNTNNTIFIGRVEISTPTQDPSFGQILLVSARDYLQTLLDRKINSNYGVYTTSPPVDTRMKRSAMITQILTDYNTPNATITTGGIATSPSTEVIFRQYASSNKTVARAIEELAQEEPWSDRTWAKVWIHTTDRTTTLNTSTDPPIPFVTTNAQYAYWGQTAPFVGVNITNVSGTASYGAFTWQYYATDHTWKALTMLQTTEFETISMARWEVPLDWDTVSVLGSAVYYYVRCITVSVTNTPNIKADCAIGIGFNYYIDENGVFQYFRKGSRPAGGPVANGLTVSLNPDATLPLTQRQIYANYEFTNQPKEIVTRVYVKGTAADTGNVVSASACNEALEKAYNTVKEKWDFISGSGMNTTELTAYAQARANSLLYSTSSTVNRGVVSVIKYPYYTILGTQLIGAADVSTTGSNTANYFTFCKFTATDSGNMNVFRVKMQVSGVIKVALYTDNAGSPGTIIKTGEGTNSVVAGWNDIVFPTVVIVSGTSYWLAYNTQVSGIVSAATTGGTRKHIAGSFDIAFMDNPVTTSSDSYTNLLQGNKATFTLIRAGDLVHAKCDMTDTDMDFEVTDIEYAEPNVSAKISLISPTAGRGQEQDDMSNILNRLKDGDDSVIPSARIGDLIAKKITANEILAGDIIVDIGLAPNGTGGGTLQSANFVHGTSGWQIKYDGVAEFQDIYLRGEIYSGKTLSVGGGSFTAGTVTLDSSGIKIKNTPADASTCSFYTNSNALGGEIYAAYPAIGLYLKSNGTINLDGGNISIAGTTTSFYGVSLNASSTTYIDFPRKNSAPSVSIGRMYYDTSASAVKYSDGVSWNTIGSLSSPAHALDSASHTAATTTAPSLTATTSVAGLMPKFGGGTTNFLRADGTWAAPPGAGNHVQNTDWGMASAAGAASGTFINSGTLMTTLWVSAGKTIQGSGAMSVGSVGKLTLFSVAGLDIDTRGYVGTSINILSNNNLTLDTGYSTGYTINIGNVTYKPNITLSSSAMTLNAQGAMLISATQGMSLNSTGDMYQSITNGVINMSSRDGLKIPQLASNPTTSYYGAVYYNNSANEIRWFNGSWVALGGGGTYLPLAGGTMAGSINMGDGLYLHGNGALYINSVNTLSLQSINGPLSMYANTVITCSAPYGVQMPNQYIVGNPAVANAGAIYYNSYANVMRYYSSTLGWVDITSGGGSMSNHAIDANPYHTAPTDNTTFNVSTFAHGFCPKLNNDNSTFLSGAGTYIYPTHFLDSSAYHLALRDITTFNVSTTAHGFAPKLTGSTTTFLRADGTWSTPVAAISLTSTRAYVTRSSYGVTSSYTMPYLTHVTIVWYNGGIGLASCFAQIRTNSWSSWEDAAYISVPNYNYGTLSFTVPAGQQYRLYLGNTTNSSLNATEVSVY